MQKGGVCLTKVNPAFPGPLPERKLKPEVGKCTHPFPFYPTLSWRSAITDSIQRYLSMDIVSPRHERAVNQHRAVTVYSWKSCETLPEESDRQVTESYPFTFATCPELLVNRPCPRRVLSLKERPSRRRLCMLLFDGSAMPVVPIVLSSKILPFLDFQVANTPWQSEFHEQVNREMLRCTSHW